jgi:hypothetical protein
MLVYHAALDINHARFRLLYILELHPEHRVIFDLLRILDFYFLFPHLLGNVTLARSMTRQKRAFAERSSKHNRVPSPKLLIRQMQGIHETAVRALMADGFVLPEPFEVQIVQRSATTVPAALEQIFASQPEEERTLASFLATELATIPLNGTNGLKARTGLLEYRYDPE